jgi:hypothetical protein
MRCRDRQLGTSKTRRDAKFKYLCHEKWCFQRKSFKATDPPTLQNIATFSARNQLFDLFAVPSVAGLCTSTTLALFARNRTLPCPISGPVNQPEGTLYVPHECYRFIDLLKILIYLLVCFFCVLSMDLFYTNMLIWFNNYYILLHIITSA